MRTRQLVKPVLDDRVYDNTVEDLLKILRQTPAEVMTLAIVGHNPGIHDLAITLDDGRGDDAACTELAVQYRISGVAVFSVSDPWTELTAGFRCWRPVSRVRSGSRRRRAATVT